MSEAQQTQDDAGTVDAYFDTPTGSVIRLRGEETEDGWTEKVEVVSQAEVMSNGRAKIGDFTVTVLFESQEGLRASQVYNQTIEPYVREELEAAREIMEEAAEQGDTITYIAQKEYVEELNEQLDGGD